MGEFRDSFWSANKFMEHVSRLIVRYVSFPALSASNTNLFIFLTSNSGHFSSFFTKIILLRSTSSSSNFSLFISDFYGDAFAWSNWYFHQRNRSLRSHRRSEPWGFISIFFSLFFFLLIALLFFLPGGNPLILPQLDFCLCSLWTVDVDFRKFRTFRFRSLLLKLILWFVNGSV